MDVKTIAMYLPQFYETEDNDRWWGKGFTDWTAVRSAKKLFEGHVQPRSPLNDNYYDLSDPKTLSEQADLARRYGISGFCFYHYYFGKGRLQLERPAENLLKHRDIDINYCFCWANESWIRSWSAIKNGNSWASDFEGRTHREEEILVEQEYGGEDEWKEHFDYLSPFLNDPRYIRIDGKPVFLIYRPELVERISERLSYCKALAAEHGLGGLYVIGVNCKKPVEGFDAVLLNAPLSGMRFDNVPADGIKLFKADDIWTELLEEEPVDGIPTYFGGFVDYDDTPRRGTQGIAVTGNSPDVFRKYLPQIMRKNIIAGNDILFLNAWNEWGEGNALEPDSRFGFGYLNAVRDTYETGEYLTEKEYALFGFADRFRHYIGKRIYLYGTGANARAIVERYDGIFNFRGLINDRDPGTAVFGKPVLSLNEAEQDSPDLIIVAAQISSEICIMDRDGGKLKQIRADIRDMYGNDLRILFDTGSVSAVIRREDYLSRIDGCDVLSIDMADTLLKRDILHAGKAFVSRDAAYLCEYALDRGKTVVFIMDGSIPVSGQIEALNAAGLSGSGEIISEREYGRNKFNGLYRILKNRYPGKRILHIGNDRGADVLAPRVYGIDSLGIPGVTAQFKAEQGPEPKGFRDKDELARMIDYHDTICFDIFDTLLARRCVRPEDVFCVTGQESGRLTGMSPETFERYRISAQERIPDGDLFEIYDEFGKLTGLDEEILEKLIRIEIETEKKLIVPRREMAEMLRYASKKGKKVILISDMYLPEEVIRDLLDSCRITGYAELVVSCEHGMRKRSGLYDALGSQNGKILMIGDQPADDGLAARQYGFDSFLIGSCVELATENGFRDIIRDIRDISGSLFTGAVISRLFNSPFGVSTNDRDSAALGALLISYTGWIAQNPITKTADGILFQERDGYLFRKIYDHVRKNIPSLSLPVSVRLPISRAAAIKLCEDRIDIDSLYTSMKAPGREADILSDYYGIERDEPDTGSLHEMGSLSERYGRQIRDTAEKQRDAFFRMIDSKSLRMGKEYALFDFYSGGFVQACLSEIVPFGLTGLYYGVNTGNILTGDLKIVSFLGDMSRDLAGCYMELERLITAPEPSVKGYSEGAAERFPEERTAEELKELRRSQNTAVRDCKPVTDHIVRSGRMIEPTLAAAVIRNIFR